MTVKVPSGASDDSVNIYVFPFVRTCCCPVQLEKGQDDESYDQIVQYGESSSTSGDDDKKAVVQGLLADPAIRLQ